MDWRLSRKDKLKYTAAERLGLTERLRRTGWAGLTAKESGQIGAWLRHHHPRQE